jgi:hypothetical protein
MFQRDHSSEASLAFPNDAIVRGFLSLWKLYIVLEETGNTVRRDGMREGAKIHGVTGPVTASWNCDAANRRLIITSDAKTAHKVVMDGAEKLMSVTTSRRAGYLHALAT